MDRFTLADMALDIVNSCWENFEGTGQLVTGGQLFSSDDYNIIVRLDPCQAGPRKREVYVIPAL